MSYILSHEVEYETGRMVQMGPSSWDREPEIKRDTHYDSQYGCAKCRKIEERYRGFEVVTSGPSGLGLALMAATLLAALTALVASAS